MRRRARGAQPLDQLPVHLEQREIRVGGRSDTYGVLVPKSSPPPGGYPLIVGLHYATTIEPGLAPYFGLGYVGQIVFPALQDLDGIVVAPDAPEFSWAHPESERSVVTIVEALMKEFRVDRHRTLVTGFSMGGQGAWFFAANHPDLFRAAIPIGALPVVTRVSNPRELQAALTEVQTGEAWTASLQRTPVYVIHSRADQEVPFASVERAVRTLDARGGRVTLAAIDDVPHHIVAGYIEPLEQARPWIRDVWAS